MKNLLTKQNGRIADKKLITTEIIDCDCVVSTIYTEVENGQTFYEVAEKIKAVLISQSDAQCCDMTYWQIENGYAQKIKEKNRHFLQQDRCELRELNHIYARQAN